MEEKEAESAGRARLFDLVPKPAGQRSQVEPLRSSAHTGIPRCETGDGWEERRRERQTRKIRALRGRVALRAFPPFPVFGGGRVSRFPKGDKRQEAGRTMDEITVREGVGAHAESTHVPNADWPE